MIIKISCTLLPLIQDMYRAKENLAHEFVTMYNFFTRFYNYIYV